MLSLQMVAELHQIATRLWFFARRKNNRHHALCARVYNNKVAENKLGKFNIITLK